jgi:hypothetical protein
MVLHPAQDVIERANGVEDVRTFVQHDAFGADTRGNC